MLRQPCTGFADVKQGELHLGPGSGNNDTADLEANVGFTKTADNDLLSDIVRAGLLSTPFTKSMVDCLSVACLLLPNGGFLGAAADAKLRVLLLGSGADFLERDSATVAPRPADHREQTAGRQCVPFYALGTSSVSKCAGGFFVFVQLSGSLVLGLFAAVSLAMYTW
jgi:hypothetical protein